MVVVIRASLWWTMCIAISLRSHPWFNSNRSSNISSINRLYLFLKNWKQKNTMPCPTYTAISNTYPALVSVYRCRVVSTRESVPESGSMQHRMLLLPCVRDFKVQSVSNVGFFYLRHHYKLEDPVCNFGAVKGLTYSITAVTYGGHGTESAKNMTTEVISSSFEDKSYWVHWQNNHNGTNLVIGTSNVGGESTSEPCSRAPKPRPS